MNWQGDGLKGGPARIRGLGWNLHQIPAGVDFFQKEKSKIDWWWPRSFRDISLGDFQQAFAKCEWVLGGFFKARMAADCELINARKN